MTSGQTRTNSKGSCIYCGRSDVLLSDEHIVPLSLGGKHILEKASCSACAKITSKFERDVTRELWGDARISYQSPSRRKNKRPTHIVLNSPDGAGKNLVVPYNDYPALMVFYKMPLAGFLQGLTEDTDTSDKWEFVGIADDSRLKNFHGKHPGQLTVKFRHVPQSFARMIAKIGYGNALTILDPGDFRAICLPYILGDKKNLSFVVGGGFIIPEAVVGQGYSMRTIYLESPSVPNRSVIVSEVRLIANAQTPRYHIIVGDVIGLSAIDRVRQKFGSEPVRTAVISSKTASFLEERI